MAVSSPVILIPSSSTPPPPNPFCLLEFLGVDNPQMKGQEDPSLLGLESRDGLMLLVVIPGTSCPLYVGLSRVCRKGGNAHPTV